MKTVVGAVDLLSPSIPDIFNALSLCYRWEQRIDNWPHLENGESDGFLR